MMSRNPTELEPTAQAVLLDAARDAFAFSVSLCRDTNAAEELVQEAYTQAWSRMDQLVDPAAARPWLFRIMHNLFLDRQRRRQRRPTFVVIDGDLGATPIGGDLRREVQARIELGELREALATLGDDAQSILRLRDAMGFSYAEIADILDCPMGTVRSRLARARHALLGALDAREQVAARGPGG